MKVSEKLDSAGLFLKHVFGDLRMEEDESGIQNSRRRGNFKKFVHWVVNFDVWGSFEPLNSQCFEIEVARAASFTKLCQLVLRLEKMCQFWE